MSKYTTGELAKLCGVTVRTVQYYDGRGILVPSALSEGGRRLYSEADLRRMQIICFLRELGLPINAIGQLLDEDSPENVLEILLEQQTQVLREEIEDRQDKLERLELLRRELRNVANPDIETVGDIANLMKNRKKLKRMRRNIFLIGIPVEAVEIFTLVYGALSGCWWPFAVGLVLEAIAAVWLSIYYYRTVAYICPQCHGVFKPTFGQMFWARHTPTTRKLKCTACGHKGFCVETVSSE